tara:strand:- start:56 stop:184 length:129 start_codon:yes stop_codon:yes gene_type:complete
MGFFVPAAPIVYYGKMDGALILIALLSLEMYIGVMVAAFFYN